MSGARGPSRRLRPPPSASDSDIAYQEGSFDEFVVVDCGAEPLQADGEIGILHLAREGLLKVCSQATGRVDIPLLVRQDRVERKKEYLGCGPSVCG